MKKKCTLCTLLPALFIWMHFCAYAGNSKVPSHHKNIAPALPPAASSLCTGASTTFIGDTPTPTGILRWELLNTANIWVAAPGLNTGADYATATLTSNGTLPRVYSFRRRAIAISGTTYDSFNDVTVNPKTAISNNVITAPAGTPSSFCVNGDPDPITGEPATGGDGVTYKYQWQQSTNGGSTFTDIAGATGQNYDPSILSTTTTFQRVATSGACNLPSVSNKVTITILNALSNNFLFDPPTTFFCIKSLFTIINGNKPAGGTGTIKYQWQKSTDGVNFTDIPNNTSPGNDYDVPVLTQTTYYRRLATSGVCTAPLISNIIAIIIEPGLSNNSITAPAFTTLCTPGDADPIKGSTPAGGNGVYKYQWQSSPDGGAFTNIAGATSQDYDPPVATATRYYQRAVTSSSCATPLVSNQVIITVKPDLAATNNTITAPATTTLCTAANPGLITGSVPAGGNSAFTYVWQKSVNGNAFADIPSSDVQSLNPGKISQTTIFRRGVTISSCTTPTFSNEVTIIVQTAITGNSITAPPVIALCQNGDPDMITGSTPAGGNGITYGYQWQQSIDGGTTFTDITGATGVNYDPPRLSTTTIYRRLVTSGACGVPSVSNRVTINIVKPVTGNVIHDPATIFFCIRSDFTSFNGDLPSGGTGTFNYQWQKSLDGVNYFDVPFVDLYHNNYATQQLTQTSYYRRLVTSGACNVPDVSNVVKITVQPGISNNSIIAPAATTFCTPGDADVIKGTPPNGGDGTYKYQWQSSPDGGSYTNIAGATAADYDPPALTASMYYRRTVTSGACTVPSVSNYISITINSNLAATGNTITAPATSKFCTAGNPGIISGSVPAGGNGIFTYVWQKAVNGTAFADIPNSNVQSFSPGTVSQTTVYRRGVIISSCTTPTYSNEITITIQTAITGNTVTPPATLTLCANGDPDVITGTPAAGGNGSTYNYQWQQSTDGGNTFTDIAGAIGLNYDPPALTTTTIYRRLVTSGACGTPSISNKITVTILKNISNIFLYTPATIFFCNQSDFTIINGNTPSGGTGIFHYQWQSSTDGINYNDIQGSGTSGNDYAVPKLTQTTWYRRSATSGSCSTPVYSNVIVITIQQGLSNNSIFAPAVAAFCASGDADIIKGSAVAGGTGIYSYQWQSSPDGGGFTNIPGATNPDYDPPVSTSTRYYRRAVTSGACTTPLISNQVMISVVPALAGNTITAPANATICAGGSPGVITGSIPAGGNGIYTFAWQSSVNGGPFTDIPNTNVQNYTPQTVSQTTTYQRNVIAGACSTPLVSNQVTIGIIPAVTSNVINQPANAVYCGASSPLTIATQQPAGGNGSFNYQWQSSTDGSNYTSISNAISATYAVPALTVTTWFKRLVSSGLCLPALPSNAVMVTVNPVPANVIVSPVTPVCAGSITTIAVVSPNPTLTYNWYDSPAKTNKLFTGPSYSVGPINATQTFYVEASNQTCTSPALTSATVTVNPLPPAPVVVNDKVSTCKGTPAVLEVSNPQSAYTYNWYITPLVNTPLYSGTKFTTPAVNNTVIYYVEAVDNTTGCLSFTPRTPVTVSPIQMPAITAQGATVCPGSPATLTTDNTDVNVTIKWYTSLSGGTSIFTGNSYTITSATANVTYYAEAVNNGCVSATRSAASIQLIQPLSAPVVSVETAANSAITFSWTAVGGASGYQVSTDGGQTFINPSSGSNGTTHIVSGLQQGQSVTIVVRATGDVACLQSINSAPVTGSINNGDSDATPIYIANAFTPNGDGKNDVVYVHHENIKSLKFYVYDQWGELLFTSQNQQKGWDGSFKGKTEPAGVYVYYLEAIMNNGKQVTKKGTITLLR